MQWDVSQQIYIGSDLQWFEKVVGTWDNIHNVVWDAQRLIELFSNCNHLIKHLPRFVIMWWCIDKLFYLESTKKSWDKLTRAGNTKRNTLFYFISSKYNKLSKCWNEKLNLTSHFNSSVHYQLWAAMSNNPSETSGYTNHSHILRKSVPKIKALWDNTWILCFRHFFPLKTKQGGKVMQLLFSLLYHTQNNLPSKVV